MRAEEIRQSVRIIRQVIDTFPEGPYYAEEAKKIFSPPKAKVLTSMEELIQNFMITTEGPQIPPGEAYFEAENPEGCAWFLYGLSRGGGAVSSEDPWPIFLLTEYPRRISAGHHMTDITVILGSLDFVMGECDR